MNNHELSSVLGFALIVMGLTGFARAAEPPATSCSVLSICETVAVRCESVEVVPETEIAAARKSLSVFEMSLRVVPV